MDFSLNVKLGLSPYGKHRLKVCGNRLLRRIFEPNKAEVTGGWKELKTEELHCLYQT
jgi:hypothetical protein